MSTNCEEPVCGHVISWDPSSRGAPFIASSICCPEEQASLLLEVTQVAGRELRFEPCPLLPPLTGLAHTDSQVETKFSKWCGIGIVRGTLATSAIGISSPLLDTGADSKLRLNLMPGEHSQSHLCCQEGLRGGCGGDWGWLQGVIRVAPCSSKVVPASSDMSSMWVLDWSSMVLIGAPMGRGSI